MPNICKCGGTADSPYNRCEQLFNTSLPVKCEVAYFIEVSDWKTAEKFVHNEIIKLGMKRFKGREWFKCKPDDVKSVFDECKKIYGVVLKDNVTVVKSDVIEKENINIDEKKKNKSYYCKYCNYSTLDSANYSHHKKSKKHIVVLDNLKIQDYEKIKKENNEKTIRIDIYEKEIFALKNELLKKDIEILKLKHNKILKKQ